MAEQVQPDRPPREATGEGKANGDRWVEMATRDIAERVNHGQHDQSKRQGDPDVGDGSSRNLVNDNRSGPGEDEAEGPEKLGSQFAIRQTHFHSVTCANGNYFFRFEPTYRPLPS